MTDAQPSPRPDRNARMVFEDPTRRRRKVLTPVVIVAMVLLAAFLVDQIVLVAVPPALSPKIARQPRPEERTLQLDGATTEPPANGRPSARPEPTAAAAHLQRPLLRTAFFVQGDPASVAALRRSLHELDIVFPDWFSFSSADGTLDKHVDGPLADELAAAGVAVFPRLSNTDAAGVWQADTLSELLRDPFAREQLIDSIVEALLARGAHGLNVDIENVNPGDGQLLLDWLDQLAQACHRRDLLIAVDLPVNDRNFDYEALGAISDFVVLMGYDQSYAGGAAGPIAGDDWFGDALDEVSRQVPPQRLLVALGAYGYDWDITARSEAASRSFLEVMQLADAVKAEIRAEPPSLNPTFSYTDSVGHLHKVWFLDAVTAWNQFAHARRVGARGFSVWRLGLEEPAIWEFLAAEHPEQIDPLTLEHVEPLSGIASVGEGELYRVAESASAGARAISFDGGIADWARYTRVPTSFVIEKSGQSGGRLVALTFDDGPDPTWTPAILDVLKRRGVRATFFVVGQQAELNPELIRREVAEGHSLGNHTYSHPNIRRISTSRLKRELNSSQRLIESITGRQTWLFRAPYDTDSSPASTAELEPLHRVTSLGYTCVGADIDPADYWRPDAGRMLARVSEAVGSNSGNRVIVLHDAGGDRTQTVALIDALIPMLESRGYRFVTVDELAGLSPGETNPAIGAAESAVVLGASVWVWGATTGWTMLLALFWVVTAVAVFRIIAVGVLALRPRNHRGDPSFTPPVTVIIPAYNEAKVIARTVRGVLQSDYPSLSVLVVDDGSTDETSPIVRALAEADPRVSLLRRANGGKSAALNAALRACPDDIVVTIDADTVITPTTVRSLVAPLSDPTVDAVCGNIQVGNVRNVLTAFQDVEYVTSQNYDRRAFDALNCISVVPGATGAWRRRSVLAVGGYSGDTLTEDADLTLTLLRAGGRVVYAPDARAVTEAPEAVRPLYRQRFRWSFGTFQCLWKHRGAFGRGTLGLVALPNMLIFQVIFPLMSPLGDAVFLYTLVTGQWSAVAAGYLLFLALDFVGSFAAFRLDRRDPRRLWVVLVQRLFYRQFMYVVAFASLWAVLRGGRHGWNKLDRTAQALRLQQA